MQIYFNNDYPADINSYLENQSVPAHQKIGALFNEVSVRTFEGSTELLSRLGISPDAVRAQRQLFDLIKDLNGSNISIKHLNNQNGVYQINNKGRDHVPIAVFKIGAKRAAMDTLVYEMARLFHLENHAVPGIFCALKDPQFDKNEDTTEELWNGLLKIYEEEASSSDEEFVGNAFRLDHVKKIASVINGVIVGILVLFCEEPEEKANLYDFTLMTMLALIISLRDGKTDGCIGSCLVDTADCMHRHIDPPNLDSVCALGLNYLDDDKRTNSYLSQEEVAKLYAIITRWKSDEIIEHLKQLKIDFEDKIAEEMTVGDSGKDGGGCSFSIEKEEEPHPVNGQYNHFENNSEKRLLNDEQITACKLRIERIVDFITMHHHGGTAFTPKELFFAVDKHAKAFADAFNDARTLPTKDAIRLSHSGNFLVSMMATQSPKSVGVSEEILSIHTPSLTRSSGSNSTDHSGSTTPYSSLEALYDAFSPSQIPMSAPIPISQTASPTPQRQQKLPFFE